MSSIDHYPRLPPYNSRTCFRYHPYPRVRRRYDQIKHLKSKNENEDDAREIILDSRPPPIYLLPVNVVNATSNDDVSTLRLEVDDRASQHAGTDAGQRQKRLHAVKRWFANAVLALWRRWSVLRAVRSYLSAKAE